MREKLMNKLIPLFAFALFTLIGLSYNVQAMEGTTTQAGAEHKATLTKVEPSLVCMINDTLFETKQIPVEVDGKTYYGCCSGCEAALKSDPSSRTAIDPVSGNEVNKATAIIGADEKGKTYYFENEENLMSYTPPAEK
jgi:YHS domain-containing protein